MYPWFAFICLDKTSFELNGFKASFLSSKSLFPEVQDVLQIQKRVTAAWSAAADSLTRQGFEGLQKKLASDFAGQSYLVGQISLLSNRIIEILKLLTKITLK